MTTFRMFDQNARAAATPPGAGIKPDAGSKAVDQAAVSAAKPTGNFDADLKALQDKLQQLDAQRTKTMATAPEKNTPPKGEPTAPLKGETTTPLKGETTTPPLPVGGAPPLGPEPVTTGASRFFGSHCAGCHTIGGGPLTGPDLKNVTGRWKEKRGKDRDELIKFLMNPKAVLDHPNDPYLRGLLEAARGVAMPDIFGMTRERAETLLEFIETQSQMEKSWFAEVPISNRPFTQDDVALGRELFVGRKPFANGGPACIACHTADGSGGPEGGMLGPDLTKVYERVGQVGMKESEKQRTLYARLLTPGTSTMWAVYQTHRLQEGEARVLVAFLKETNSNGVECPPVPPLKLILLGLGGAVLGLGALTALCGSRFWRVR